MKGKIYNIKIESGVFVIFFERVCETLDLLTNSFFQVCLYISSSEIE